MGCGVGYRAERVVRLARAVVAKRLDITKLESIAETDECSKLCSTIFGLGPFGVANVLQLLGHYERIPADSETARHLRQARGVRSCNLGNVQDKAATVYAGYAP